MTDAIKPTILSNEQDISIAKKLAMDIMAVVPDDVKVKHLAQALLLLLNELPITTINKKPQE